MNASDTVERAVRVLVVEDDRDQGALFTEVLRARGYDVRLARDGEEAMRLACKNPPDLVLLDVVLPKQSGYLVAAKLKLFGAGPKVLLVTGMQDRRSPRVLGGTRGHTPGQLAAFLGVDGILYKPFSARQLVQTIETLVGRRQRQVAAVGSV